MEKIIGLDGREIKSTKKVEEVKESEVPVTDSVIEVGLVLSNKIAFDSKNMEQVQHIQNIVNSCLSFMKKYSQKSIYLSLEDYTSDLAIKYNIDLRIGFKEDNYVNKDVEIK